MNPYRRSRPSGLPRRTNLLRLLWAAFNGTFRRMALKREGWCVSCRKAFVLMESRFFLGDMMTTLRVHTGKICPKWLATGREEWKRTG